MPANSGFSLSAAVPAAITAATAETLVDYSGVMQLKLPALKNAVSLV